MPARTIDVRLAVCCALLIAIVAGAASPVAVSFAASQLPGRGAESPRLAVPAGSAFNFQGRLDIDGVPADGSYDFEFRLFDVESGGTPLPSALFLVATTANVSNGQFSVALDFGENTFNGEARWLEVSARQGLANFVTLPRQPLSPTPYAMFSLRTTYSPAGPVNGTADVAARSDHTHMGQAWTANLPSGAGLSITNSSGTGVAIAAYAAGASGFLGYRSGIGVVGALGAGICGSVSLDSISAGLYGSTCSSQVSSVGIRGYGVSTGVLGESIAGGGSGGIGVIGTAGAQPPVRPSNTGVYGYGSGANSTGVYGRADGTNAFAVKGIAPTSAEYAGYFSGKVEITGALITPSDIRLKKDLAPLAYGLDAINALQPMSYHMVDDESGAVRMGLVAQDLQAIIPELVVEDSAGMLSVNYLELIPVLTRAIQEQQDQIEALQRGSPASGESTGGTAMQAPATLFASGFIVVGLLAVAWQLSRRRSDPAANAPTGGTR